MVAATSPYSIHCTHHFRAEWPRPRPRTIDYRHVGIARYAAPTPIRHPGDMQHSDGFMGIADNRLGAGISNMGIGARAIDKGRVELCRSRHIWADHAVSG